MIVGINCFVDQYRKSIVGYLLKGKNVTNVNVYDEERLLQKCFIKGLKECPDVVVFGSSRTMLISSEYFNSGTLINNGVGAASIEDILEIYRLYQKKGFKPKKIILGLDPWLLNDNHKATEWKKIGLEYLEMLKELGLSNEGISKKAIILENYHQVASVGHFRASLAEFSSYLKNRINKKYLPTDKTLNDQFTRLKDGSITYPKKYREFTPKQVTEEVMNYIDGRPIIFLNEFNKLSDLDIKLLERFITYLKKQNTEIVFFLAPYHPLVFDYFTHSEKYKMVIKAEEYYRALAKKMNIEVLGSFNPEKCKIDSSLFYDGLHCKEEAIKIILSKK